MKLKIFKIHFFVVISKEKYIARADANDLKGHCKNWYLSCFWTVVRI